MSSLPVRLALAIIAGLLAALSFEPFGWALVLPVAVAGVTLAVLGTTVRRGFLLGAAFGVVFMLVLLPWMRIIGTDAWIALSLLQALFYGLAGLGTVLVHRLPWWPVWAATLWVGVELLRGTIPFGGFPWGRLAFATVDTPLAANFAYVGSAGTSFLVALLGTALAWAVTVAGRVPVRAVVTVAVVGVLASAASIRGVFVPAAEAVDAGEGVLVAAVQGNVPGEGMDAFAERRAVLNNHVSATLELADRIDNGEPRPDIVIWPESSTDIDPFTDASAFADIQAAVDAVGVPILVGAMVGGENPRDVLNQGIVWEPGSGPAQRYSKRHPVPFGEYIPFREQLAQYFARLDQIPRDMLPGDRPGRLEINGVRVGDVICFEVAYDALVRDAVAGGADLLVVQTNNATYMGTGQVEQQFAISRLRAIETGRTVVVAATNGVSGIIDDDGEVVERAPVRTQSVLLERVAAPGDRPVALSVGPWVEAVLAGAAAIAVLLGLGVGYRRRSRRAEPAPDPAGVEA